MCIRDRSGIARTALYKTFRNKEHIFRALAKAVHGEALEIARGAFASEGNFNECLTEALIGRDTHLLTVGHTGPHANEIAELYLSLASDLADESNAALTDLIAAMTKKAVASGKFDVPHAYRSTKDFARLLRLALEGVKKEVKSPQEFEKLARQIIEAMI